MTNAEALKVVLHLAWEGYQNLDDHTDKEYDAMKQVEEMYNNLMSHGSINARTQEV